MSGNYLYPFLRNIYRVINKGLAKPNLLDGFAAGLTQSALLLSDDLDNYSPGYEISPADSLSALSSTATLFGRAINNYCIVPPGTINSLANCIISLGSGLQRAFSDNWVENLQALLILSHEKADERSSDVLLAHRIAHSAEVTLREKASLLQRIEDKGWKSLAAAYMINAPHFYTDDLPEAEQELFFDALFSGFNAVKQHTSVVHEAVVYWLTSHHDHPLIEHEFSTVVAAVDSLHPQYARRIGAILNLRDNLNLAHNLAREMHNEENRRWLCQGAQISAPVPQLIRLICNKANPLSVSPYFYASIVALSLKELINSRYIREEYDVDAFDDMVYDAMRLNGHPGMYEALLGCILILFADKAQPTESADPIIANSSALHNLAMRCGLDEHNARAMLNAYDHHYARIPHFSETLGAKPKESTYSYY